MNSFQLFDLNDYEILSPTPEGGGPILWVNASFEGIHEDWPVDCTTSIELTPEDTERLLVTPHTHEAMIDFVNDLAPLCDWEPVTD